MFLFFGENKIINYYFMKKLNFLAVLLSGLLSAQATFTLVKDIYPGAVGSLPGNLTLFNGKMYFSAASTVNGSSIGTELWESDGTENGTKLVADILPGTSSSNPNTFFANNSKLYFTSGAVINGTNNFNVFMSYDAVNGVQNVSTTVKSPSGFTQIGNTLYFKANNTAVTPQASRLYYFDTNSQPVIADDNTNVALISSAGNKILATAQYMNASNIYNYQLFAYDGTALNLLKTINPSAMSYPQLYYASSVLGKTIFNATGPNGNEPYVTDGTEQGTVMLKDINTSSATAGSGTQNFIDFKGKVFFTGSDGNTTGAELYTTDGTSEGTALFKDIVAGSGSSAPEKLTVFNDKLYFFATMPGNVKQLWESDGTPLGTKALADVNTAGGLLVYNNNLYFSGRVSIADTIGAELYKVNLPDATLAVADTSKSEIRIYPNPSKGTFFVNGVKAGIFEMYDFSGRMVKAGKISEGKVSVNAAAGNYILKVKSDDNKISQSQKVVIQ